jgi:hypothetical protein
MDGRMPPKCIFASAIHVSRPKKRRLQFTIWMSGTGNVRRAIHWLFSGIVSVILIVQLTFERWTLEKHSIFGE